MTKRSSQKQLRNRQAVAQRPRIVDLAEARAMRPLLRRILADLVDLQALIAHKRCLLEDASLAKQIRFRLEDELDWLYADERALVAELRRLGASLVTEAVGAAALPTLVNGRKAELLYFAEDEDIRFWRYAGESCQRELPKCWYQTPVKRTKVA